MCACRLWRGRFLKHREVRERDEINQLFICIYVGEYRHTVCMGVICVFVVFLKKLYTGKINTLKMTQKMRYYRKSSRDRRLGLLVLILLLTNYDISDKI